MDFLKSETKINLMRAFAGESQARNRYNLSAEKAYNDGFYQVAKVFNLTASQEQAHATVFYNHLKEANDSHIEICASYPVNIYQTTLDYLKAGVENEEAEYKEIYQNFGNIAKEEGFIAIAQSFFSIAEIENTHSKRFKMLMDMLMQDTLYKSSESAIWICTNCGHIHQGTQAPVICPVCSHKQGHFIEQCKIDIF